MALRLDGIGPSASLVRRVKIVLAGLLFAALAGFVVATLGTSQGGVSETIAGSALLVYLATGVALPLLVLTDAGYASVGRIRRTPGTVGRSTGTRILSSLFRVAELSLAAVILLVYSLLGYLHLTRPAGPGAGALVIGGVLLITLVGGCLAATVLADSIDIRSGAV